MDHSVITKNKGANVTVVQNRKYPSYTQTYIMLAHKKRIHTTNLVACLDSILSNKALFIEKSLS
jgi:hypothetical protein